MSTGIVKARPVVAAMVVAIVTAATPVTAQTSDPAARLLADAERKASAGDVAGATEDWKAVLSSFGDSEQATIARISLADVAVEARDWTAAAEYAQAVVDTDPQSSAAARAWVILGEARLSEGGAAAHEAAETFARAWDLFPGGDGGTGASAAGRVREGEVRLRLGQPRVAEKAFLDVVETQPIGPWTTRAYRGLVRARTARGEWPAAIEALQEGISRASAVTDPDPGTAADLADMRRLAEAAHRVYLRGEDQPMWSESVQVSGLELKRPVAVHVGNDGTLTIADRGLDVVLQRAEDGSVQRQAWTDTGRPFSDEHGAVWVPVEGRLQTPGLGSRPVGDGQTHKKIEAGAAAGFGAFLLTTRPDSVIQVTDDLAVARTIQVPQRTEIVDIASDSSGRAVLLDRRGGAILRTTGETGTETVVSGLDKPVAVAVGPFDHLYALEREGRVSVFTPEGKRMTTIGPNLPGGLVLRGAEDLAVDRSGRLWIADSKEAMVIQLGGNL